MEGYNDVPNGVLAKSLFALRPGHRSMASKTE